MHNSVVEIVTVLDAVTLCEMCESEICEMLLTHLPLQCKHLNLVKIFRKFLLRSF